MARPPSLAEIALPIFGGQIERQYEHAKAAEQAIRGGQPAAKSIAQAYAPNVSELVSPEATRGEKIQAGVNIAAEVAPFLVPALRGIGKYGVAGRSLSDIAFGAKPEPLAAETAAAEQVQKGGEISAQKPYSETGAVSTEQGKPAIGETAVQTQKGDTRQTLAQTPAAPQVTGNVRQFSTAWDERGALESKAMMSPEEFARFQYGTVPPDEVLPTLEANHKQVVADALANGLRANPEAIRRYGLQESVAPAVPQPEQATTYYHGTRGEFQGSPKIAKTAEEISTGQFGKIKVVGSVFKGFFGAKEKGYAGLYSAGDESKIIPFTLSPDAKVVKLPDIVSEEVLTSRGWGRAKELTSLPQPTKPFPFQEDFENYAFGRLNQERSSRGAAPFTREQFDKRTSGEWNPSHQNYDIEELASKYLPDYLQSKGYDAVEMGREIAVLNPEKVVTQQAKPVSTEGQAAVSEQPRIISTAVQTPEGIKTGASFNQPHDEIVKGAPEETKGFMVRDANGQERFVGRTEAADVAKAAGQVKPENAGTTELHSQQLAPVSKAEGAPVERLGELLASEQPTIPLLKERTQLLEQRPEVSTGTPYESTVYRGSRGKSVDEGMYGKGTYYSQAKETAANYGTVTEGKVTLNNPFVVTEKNLSAINNLIPDKLRLRRIQRGLNEGQINELNSRMIRRQLEARGHDGIVLRWSKSAPDEVVVFDPVKSVATTEQPSPQTPAITEPTTAQPLLKTEPPLPPETPEELGQALKEPGRTAGVANRVLQERAAKGEIPQAPAAGEGHLTEDIINKSRAEYSPERALVAAQNVRNGSLSEADAGQVRIHEEALTKIAANAEKALDADPKNPALQEAYNTAKAALTQWHNDTVQPMKTTWSNAGKSMQGATDIDTGSYIGLQKLAWDTAKRDFTAKEEPVMRLAAKRVSKLTDDVRSAISSAEDQVQKVLKPSKYMDLNQLRESLAETLKSITC